eukprot:3588566-Prymnesium_polylepis.2
MRSAGPRSCVTGRHWMRCQSHIKRLNTKKCASLAPCESIGDEHNCNGRTTPGHLPAQCPRKRGRGTGRPLAWKWHHPRTCDR